jgi:hypothetical protein
MCTWEYNFKMDLREVGWWRGGVHKLDVSGSGYEQVAGSCEYYDEPSGSIKYREFLEWLRT